MYLEPKNQMLKSQIENIFDLIGNLTYNNQKSKIDALPFFANIPKNIWEGNKSLTSCYAILLDNFQLSLYYNRIPQKETIRGIADRVLEEIGKQNVSKSDILLLRKIMDLKWKFKKELIKYWEPQAGFIFMGKILEDAVKNKSDSEILLKKRA